MGGSGADIVEHLVGTAAEDGHAIATLVKAAAMVVGLVRAVVRERPLALRWLWSWC